MEIVRIERPQEMDKMKLLIFLVVVLCLVGSASATDYYVATDGDNGDPGTIGEPWATLTYSETQLSDGDTVYVRGGSYHQRWTIEGVNNVSYIAYPGESPIIDGEWDIPVAPDVYTSYGTLLSVYAYGTVIDGFVMKNSTGNILTVHGSGVDNVIIRNCTLYDCYRHALQLSGGIKGTLVEDCDMYSGAGVLQFCSYNPSSCRDLGYEDPATVTTPYTEDAIFRRCKIHDSHNEGINIEHGTNNVTVEYCEIYGNRKSQLYVVSGTNHTVRYNLIYGTEENRIGQAGNGGPGIMISHEYQWIEEMGLVIDMSHLIYENLVANLKSGVDTQLHYSGAKSTNISIYNNIFVEAENYGIICGSGTGDDSTYKNNIIWQEDGECASVPSGLTFDYNLWSKTPDTDAQGTNDPTYAIPQILKSSGWTTLTGGELDGSEFTLNSTSPAIDVGTDLGSPYNMALSPTSTWVDDISLLDQDDYGSAWEIGAFVYEPVDTYYVKNGGNDSADGLTDATAWETVGKVNGFSFNTGDDVTYVFVDWNGTTENNVTIGSYYGDGIIGVSGDRPILDGEDTEPTDNYDGMITIENRENITVENIHVQRSAGYGIWTYESQDILIDNVIINRTYKQGNYFKDSSYCVLQYSNISETCRYGNGAVVAFWGSDHVDILYNVLHETSYDQIVMNSGREGINFLHSDYSTAIGNIIYDCRGMGIYFDHAQNALAEYNLIYYTGDTDYWRSATKPAPGIVFTDEVAQGSTHLNSDIVVKNNLIANSGIGIALWSGALNTNDPALVNVSIFNNIVVLPNSTDNSERSLEIGVSERHSNSTIKNNIFWQTANSIAYVQATAEITFSNNLWSQAQGSVDTDAQGSNDIYGELPDLYKSTGWDSISDLTGAEFTLNSTSPAIDNGTNLGSSYDQGLASVSTWVDDISLLDQDDYGTAWEIGAFVYGTAEEEQSISASDFGLYKIITINQTMVNQSIGTGTYPLLVSTTDTDLRDHVQTDGDDIVFFASDNTTQLAYEQEFWNSANGELVEWVGVEDITNVTHIVMYYNNSTIANSENATGVWDSNFVVVQHLNETPAGTTYDSTSNNNDGTTVGMDSADQVSGQVDGCLDFDGADRISLTTPAIDNNAAFTISTWMYGEPGNIVYGEGYSGDTAWSLFLGIEENPPYSARFYYKESGSWKALTTGTTQVNDTWHHVVLSQTSKSSRTMYIDGIAEETDTDVVGDVSILDVANIGVLQRSDFASYFVGQIDELRISDTARSHAWTETEYNNTASPERMG